MLTLDRSIQFTWIKVSMSRRYESTFLEESDDGETMIKPFSVDSFPNDYNISVLMSLLDQGFLKIPSFQRNYVWTREMASKFIESIIIGLPIPQIFFFEQNRNNYLVIDGQQRLISIYLFKMNRFPKNNVGRGIIRKYLSQGLMIPKSTLFGDNFEPFNLKLAHSTEVKNPLNGRNYNTLPRDNYSDYKGKFDFGRTIRTITIKQIEPDDNYSSMFEIYSRLNSGGVTLKPQEIRTSLFYSPFYDSVSEINTSELWRQFIGKKEPDLHMRDIETLIRAFAMCEMYSVYKPPMSVFLNIFSEKSRGFDEQKIEMLKNQFANFLSACTNLNKDSFKNDKGKFIISLFDSIFVAVCSLIAESGLNNRHIDPNSITRLKQDSEFIKAVQQRTASLEHVHKRIEKAKEYITLI